MWLPKIGKLRQVVAVWANHIGRHFASRDQIEDAIGHIIGESTAIEESLCA